MKAEIGGITLTGTPQEIAEVIKLAGLVKEIQTIIRYVPQPEPVQPWPGGTWIWTKTCSAGTTYTGSASILWNGYDGPDAAGSPVPAN